MKIYFAVLSCVSAIGAAVVHFNGRVDFAVTLNVWAAAFAVIAHMYWIEESKK